VASDDPPPRRRRRRSTSEPDASSARSLPPADTDSQLPARTEPAKPRRKRPAGDAASERGLRELAGGGPSQLGVSGALRGRDVNRPTQDDIAAAERDLVIVRRSRPAGDN
jgi:hypothetical protein